MKLCKLTVKNFCCISDKELDIKIDNIVVLIGPNNVGKSTVLKAYEAFSGTGSPLGVEFFHKSSSAKPIEIYGMFTELSDEDKAQIGTKWIYNSPEFGDVIRYKWVWEKPDTKAEKYSWDSDENKWIKGGMGGWDTKISSCVPTPLLISPTDDPIEFQKKIIEIITQAVKQSVKKDSSKLNVILKEINKLAMEVEKELEDELSETTKQLEKNLQDVFPKHGVKIQSEAGKIEPEKILLSGSHIRIKDPNGQEYPLESQGTGLRRAFLWSALSSLSDTDHYKKNKKTIGKDSSRILLIEEPEVYLHPPGIRASREALYKISEIENWQVMLSTHSPIFIDISKPHTTIIRVEKTEGESTKTFSTNKAGFEENERKRLQMIRACHPSINEFFFSDFVILVEGDTEQAVLNEILIRKGKEKNYQVVNCLGKANIPMFEKILTHFTIPFIVIHDSDAPKYQREDEFRTNGMWTMNETIFNESNGNKVVINVPDFEWQFFGTLQKGDKPFNAIKKLNDEEFQKSDEYKELLDLLDSINEDRHPRIVKSTKTYTELTSEYVKHHNPQPEGCWKID